MRIWSDHAMELENGSPAQNRGDGLPRIMTRQKNVGSL
jgi:hypothetical protein